MNSTELRNILCCTVPKEYETGVYACDQLSFVKNKAFAIICNNQESTERGGHWIAFFKRKCDESVEMFDSFGMPVTFYSNFVNQFLKCKGKYVIRSNLQLQSNFSNVCGQFCVYFLVMRIQNMSFLDIINSFGPKKEANDFKVYQFVKQNFCYELHSNNDCVCNHICSHIVQRSKKY